jgi:tetratricopeptide (TPR) repeat protein
VDDNRKKAQELGVSGTFGTENYQLMMAHLKQTKPAYEAHDKGRKALSDGKPEEALALARKALKMEPKEALFHALRGDVRYMQKNYRDALINYNRAIEKNPTFFHFFVQRGLTKEKLGDPNGAKTDLNNSLKMLPTATAYKALGDIALAQGDRQTAVKYYEAASGSSSEAGKAALASLIRIDLPSRPGRYLKAQVGLGRNGYAHAQIINQTPVAVKNIRLTARFPDTKGRIREIPLSIRQALLPGQAAAIPLPMGQVKDASLLKYISVAVVGAELANTR